MTTEALSICGSIYGSAAWSVALVAYSGGMMFLTNGYQESASMMMAVAFTGAFITYGLAAFVSAPRASLALARRD